MSWVALKNFLHTLHSSEEWCLPGSDGEFWNYEIGKGIACHKRDKHQAERKEYRAKGRGGWWWIEERWRLFIAGRQANIGERVSIIASERSFRARRIWNIVTRHANIVTRILIIKGRMLCNAPQFSIIARRPSCNRRWSLIIAGRKSIS